ncbi:hypothetical protein V2J09_005806 [Rumex salicifolius]
MVEKKYNAWFDDFPVGCGACGDLDHDFEDPIEIEDDDIEGEAVEVEFIQEEDNEDTEDTLVVDPPPTIPEIENYPMSPLFQESDVSFTDEEFNVMLNADRMFDPPNPDFSDCTFHSMHNSIFSSSSMINHLEGLE